MLSPKLTEVIKEIKPIDQLKKEEVSTYIDQLTKPQGSLGRLEELAITLAQITSSSFPVVSPPGVIVFAADHGIAAEGVSAFPQEVTAQMIYNFLQGGAAINVFARQMGAYFSIVDVGVAQDLEMEGSINKKVRYGTGNFLQEEAMTREEAFQALEAGIESAEQMVEQGAKCLVFGEMGIGNTTTSSAILAVLSEKEIDSIVGKGSGIIEEQLAKKRSIIAQALNNRQPNSADPIDILSKVGGLEIAAMAGAMMGSAHRQIPILLDGFICTVAALLAVKLCPEVKGYMIAGHQSEEPGHAVALDMLGLTPLLRLNLRLGEGSGAALAFPLLESACRMVSEMATFSSAGVSNKE
ncbi:nicotinate-nucleotide--dimethylbenzimidazole phosphoribosyltransferase [Caldalkalibacillus mannanilyticus]|uniref:nicotinate-nucleotide--dimethylbenzimidazole phosphoribosyltransferase n=1 Tax=Caldalkalibacillus mannanilyticus TaxID=1418 RepID=UPI0004686DF6|nr:nicotinate-nucleotide--dimethylbenzimidazole phosphoribosyltransferase [Caldalkalibacillus mannanilyticus]